MTTAQPRYRRIILKLSGEGLATPGGFGVHREPLDNISGEISAALGLGVQIGVVVGGGNFLRGSRFAEELGLHRATADYMGMLGTVLNAMALQEALIRRGHEARIQSSLAVARIGEPFHREESLRHLAAGRVVILAAGTGNPHVTTDSCAAQRGVELDAEAVLKATKVDGVYDSDPVKNPNAKLYTRLTHDRVIDERLRVMDLGAVEMCREYKLPIIVFNLFQPGTLKRILLGESLGTHVATE